MKALPSQSDADCNPGGSPACVRMDVSVMRARCSGIVTAASLAGAAGITAFVFAISSALAVGPSFDCGKVKTPFEQLICSDPDLSKTDLEFVRAYYVESAVQNAAENALKQVVGSLIDAEKQVERRSQIADGIRSETRNVSSKIREYSQGSIRSFEVLETSQDGAIVRVAARVGVRIDDFKAYIQKVAEGEATVDRGLYPQVAAQAAVQQQQNADKTAIFLDRVLTPVFRGDGVSLTVGKLEPASADNVPGCAAHYKCRENTFVDWYIIPVKLLVDEDFIKNLEQTVKQIASSVVVASEMGASPAGYLEIDEHYGVVFPYGRSATSRSLYDIEFPHELLSNQVKRKLDELNQGYERSRIILELFAEDGQSIEIFSAPLHKECYINCGNHQDFRVLNVWSRMFFLNGPKNLVDSGGNRISRYMGVAPASGTGQTLYLLVKIPSATLKEAVRVAVSITP